MKKLLLVITAVSLLAGCTQAPERPTELNDIIDALSDQTRSDTTQSGEPQGTNEPEPLATPTPEAPSPSPKSSPGTQEALPTETSPEREPSTPPSGDPEPSAPAPVDPAPSSTIGSYVDKMRLQPLAVDLFLSTEPVIVDSARLASECSDAGHDSNGLLGCYTSYPSRIFLFDITNARMAVGEPVVAAHEMLHAAWYQHLTSSERSSIGAQLTSFYNALPQDHFLRARIALYEANGTSDLVTELHSFIGTEIRSLPSALESHYARYFTNRLAVVELAESSFGALDALEDELDELSAELNGLQDELAQFRESVTTLNNQLSADIAAFNERADSGGYTSEEEFNRDRDALQSRQTDINIKFDVLNERVAAYNTKVNAYNEKRDLYNSWASALNRS